MERAVLTLKEAAEMLHLCGKTVVRQIEDKKLKASKVGHQWRIRRSAIEAFLEQSERDFAADGRTK